MIELENVAIRQGEFHFDKLSLTVELGQHAVLMGRSGCGKTNDIGDDLWVASADSRSRAYRGQRGDS